MPETSGSLKDNILEVKEIDNKLNIINKLKAISTMVKTMEGERKAGYYLLDLDIYQMRLKIRGYKTRDYKYAIEDYDYLESLEREMHDVVLVSASSVKELKKAYPNYFGDIKQFISKMEECMMIYN